MNWKKEFFSLLAPATPNDSLYDKAFQIKYDHLPKRLFRYFSPEVHNLASLRNRKLWASKPQLFNDPYECSFTRDGKKLAETCLVPLRRSLQANYPRLDFSFVNFLGNSQFPKQYDSIAEKLLGLLPDQNHPGMGGLKGSIENLREMIAKLEAGSLERESLFASSMYVCSFSEKVNSILMWSHYATNHKGFVVEYDFSKLPFADERTVNLFPVKYVSTLPVQDNIEQTGSDSVRYQNVFGLHVMVSKHLDWSYEREWRLVDTMDRGIGRVSIESPPISRVYLGAKMDNDVEVFLIDICRMLSVDFRKMEMDKKFYRLSPSMVGLKGTTG